jgi:hypothetical protein
MAVMDQQCNHAEGKLEATADFCLLVLVIKSTLNVRGLAGRCPRGVFSWESCGKPPEFGNHSIKQCPGIGHACVAPRSYLRVLGTKFDRQGRACQARTELDEGGPMSDTRAYPRQPGNQVFPQVLTRNRQRLHVSADFIYRTRNVVRKLSRGDGGVSSAAI